MSEQIWVDSRPLFLIGAAGELSWSTTANGGSEQASWRMSLPNRFSHPSLRTGKLVEIKAGTHGLFAGLLSQPRLGDDGWDFEAQGLSEELYTSYLCLDAAKNSTSTPDTAVTQAIARGFPGSLPTSLSNVPFAAQDQTDGLNYVGALLDAWAGNVSKRWMVNGSKQVVAYTDPTTPTWYMVPRSARLGLADDDYASDIFLRFKSGPGSFDTVEVKDSTADGVRHREYGVDATPLGVSTAAKVTNVGNGLLAKGKARYGWTDSVDLSGWQLVTPGFQPASLKLVKGGDLVRALGVRNDQQGLSLPYYDWVIGRTQYNAGANTIQLAPVQMAARSLADVFNLAVK